MGQAAPKTKQQLIDEALQKKIDLYTHALERKCEKLIQDRASEIVDSLLLVEAQIKTVDTFERPPKPNKPAKPDERQIRDSSAISPLFNQ